MKTLFLFFVFCFSFTPAIYAGGDWQVNKERENNVTFYSSTTMLDFDGTTNNIDGYIYWEGDSLFGNRNEIYFEVDLARFFPFTCYAPGRYPV